MNDPVCVVLRFISTHQGLLLIKQQDELKNMVVDRFINPLLGSEEIRAEDAIYSIEYKKVAW